ncbi:hypothetical protein D3C75_1038780 [compost metagenome]
MGRGLEAAGDDFGGVGTGVDAERQAGAEGSAGQQRPQEAFAHRLELRQAVVDQEQLHQHRRAADHVGVQPRHEIDRWLLGHPHQAQRNGRQQPEEQRNRQQLEGGQQAAEVHRQCLPDDVVVEDHSSATLTPTE